VAATSPAVAALLATGRGGKTRRGRQRSRRDRRAGGFSVGVYGLR
jgi:hypothetical protein